MTASTSSRLHLIVFGLVCVVYAVITFSFLRSFGMQGNWYGAAVAALFASTIPMGLVAFALEDRGSATLFDTSKGSWAFILGDAFALPLVAAASALVWTNIPDDSNWRSGYWTAASIAVGLAASAGFHWGLDAGVYTPEQSLSPTKIVHDFVAYPVLFGGLMLLAVPAITQGWSLGPAIASVLAIVGIVGWIAFGARDTYIAKPNPNDLHVAWDWATLSVIEPEPAPATPS